MKPGNPLLCIAIINAVLRAKRTSSADLPGEAVHLKLIEGTQSEADQQRDAERFEWTVLEGCFNPVLGLIDQAGGLHTHLTRSVCSVAKPLFDTLHHGGHETQLQRVSVVPGGVSRVPTMP